MNSLWDFGTTAVERYGPALSAGFRSCKGLEIAWVTSPLRRYSRSSDSINQRHG